MAFGLLTGKYKFASPVPKRNPSGPGKVLNMDIKDFGHQLVFSIILNRERSLSHIQIRTSSATHLKSTFLLRVVAKKSGGHWECGQVGWLPAGCMTGQRGEARNWRTLRKRLRQKSKKISSTPISMSKENVADTTQSWRCFWEITLARSKPYTV